MNFSIIFIGGKSLYFTNYIGNYLRGRAFHILILVKKYDLLLDSKITSYWLLVKKRTFLEQTCSRTWTGFVIQSRQCKKNMLLFFNVWRPYYSYSGRAHISLISWERCRVWLNLWERCTRLLNLVLRWDSPLPHWLRLLRLLRLLLSPSLRFLSKVSLL